jgi:aminoglycoside phosphotransferase (APT) family kinase protein
MPELGPLIAQGRAADVFAYGDGLVLRRYRTTHSVLYEAAVMQYVRDHGFPVPEVVEVSGPDMVMERVTGAPMLDDFARHPWRLFRHARTLAELHRRLHAIPPPPWLEDRLEGGDAIVHLDLHPLNVIITSHGPVVIDWTNAGRGDPDAEVADLWLILANAEIPGSRILRTVMGLGRGLFLRAFLRYVDRDGARKRLRIAAAHRLRDRNMLDSERTRIVRFVERRAIEG